MVTSGVIDGSESWKSGRYFTMGSDHLTVPSPTACAITEAPSDFDTEASWKTVFSSTTSGLPTSRTP